MKTLWKLEKGGLKIPVPYNEDGTLPREIELFKKGKTETENGPYTFNDVSKKLIEKEIKRRNIRYFSDWHHASLDEAPRDPRLSAAASSHYDLEFRNGDMWAVNIDWTPDGADDLKNKRYMYISPAFDTDKQGVVMSYRNFALTNDPATHEIKPLIAAESKRESEESTMDEDTKKALDEIAKSLESIGKSHEETTKRLGKMEETVSKHFKKLKAKAEDEDEEDEEDEDEDEDEESRKSEDEDEDEESRKSEKDPDDPGDEDDEDDEKRENETDEDYSKRMQKRLSALRKKSGLHAEIRKLTVQLARARGQQLSKQNVREQIDHAVRRGYIPKSLKPYCIANPKAFLRMMSSFKKKIIVPPAMPGAQNAGEATTLRTGQRQLTKDETVACERMGISQEEYISGKPTKPAESK